MFVHVTTVLFTSLAVSQSNTFYEGRAGIINLVIINKEKPKPME